MFSGFTQNATTVIDIELVILEEYSQWLNHQQAYVTAWLNSIQFIPKAAAFALLPNSDGQLQKVILIVKQAFDLWDVAGLPLQLPKQHTYQISNANNAAQLEQIIFAWGLGAYQFRHYKEPTNLPANLLVTGNEAIWPHLQAYYHVRDWVNTPAQDLMPARFIEIATEIAGQCAAKLTVISGEDLLLNNYPSIYAVGRASIHEPRLIDLRWGNPAHPKVTLVGKGVCFDTGGLDIKPAAGMLAMKKDMGGAAHALALAKLIMQTNLPVCLRVLLPCVDNAISGNAYRPGDVLQTRKGLSVEVTNTDAEGRIILADALYEASLEQPDYLFDFATLTGAARTALGTEVPAFFTHHESLATELMHASVMMNDPMWRLPIYKPYRSNLDSSIADMKNADLSGFGGAIIAALYLNEFVDEQINWVHFDIYSTNQKSRPGRPEGGEAMTLRAVYQFLQQKYTG